MRAWGENFIILEPVIPDSGVLKLIVHRDSMRATQYTFIKIRNIFEDYREIHRV